MKKYLPKSVKAYCEVCGHFVKINIKEEPKINASGLATIYYTHGEPKHTLVVYVDKHFSVRGEAVIKTGDPSKALSELKKTHIKRLNKKLKKK